MLRFFHIITILIIPCIICAENPKREFRGAWMHTIGQSQYANQSTEQNQEYLRHQLDLLQQAGINAILFQVRPSADALYQSDYEPWSKFLCPNREAPSPYWDPLQFMIEETHSRGMELHAWLNPYRVTTAKGETLPPGHLYHKEPHRFVKYEGDGKIYFDPGIPENRDFITTIVLDIINRYDVDGIHFDDYFYPYPANKKDFPDDKSYAKYGNGLNRGDWRRQNVDKLIEMLHDSIRASEKPWVRFGISPFGIWRNKKSDPRGSDTSGLQNYDDLYADVLLWAQKGWIDYLIPQLYWELEHPRASYLTLVEWWAEAVDPRCQLYIGQDVEKTMSKPDLPPSTDTNQLDHKVSLSREFETIDGNCWWPAYSITRNSNDCATLLAEDYQATIAIPPAYPDLSDGYPQPVKKVKIKGNTLSWESNTPKGKANDAARFVVYNFPTEEEIDYEDPSFIIAITNSNSIEIDDEGFYSVTTLDHANNESHPSVLVMKK